MASNREFLVSQRFAVVRAVFAWEHVASVRGSLASLPLSSDRVLSVSQRFASGRAFSALQCLAVNHVLLDAASHDLLLYVSAAVSLVSQRPVSDYVLSDVPSHGLLLYASAAAPSDAGIQASVAAPSDVGI